ncbi:MAG TPA: hypothetical protein PKK26_02055 [Candidatus Wallbacteria bacterium]|nr:hypothetical protein [Candidatus Wallbacteria bacterium]
MQTVIIYRAKIFKQFKMRTFKKVNNKLAFWFLVIFTVFLAMHSGCGGTVINNDRQLVSLKVSPQTPEIKAGSKLCFAASGVDDLGGSLIVSPAWEAHDGTIDSAGVYIAPNYQTIDRVSAIVGKISGTAVISIKPQPEAVTLEIHPDTKFLTVGANQKFYVVGKNQFGEEVPVTVTWSCRFGNINSNGEYIAPLHPEHDAVIAKTISATGSMPFDITPREAYKIFIAPKSMQVKASNGGVFTASVFDVYGNKIENLSLRYSAMRGKIDNSGNYLAKADTGTDEIGVTYNYITDSASVEIVP